MLISEGCLYITFLLPLTIYADHDTENISSTFMTEEEKQSLKNEAAEMFYHAYNAYMDHAYPADELMPLSCTGRYRGSHPSRGNVDEALGNFSLTLIDSLDTLAILGNLAAFEEGVNLVIRDVSFDRDVVVSVFETNIRVLGGLLSAHILAEYFKGVTRNLQSYNGELLELAKDLGYRLLPAFNTTTGIPCSRVNLNRGVIDDYFDWCYDTCTACAGTMILEMAALSRLTRIPVFEEKAHRAMDELWNMRHRTSNLMGTVLNVNSGSWIRKDSGVGAGIDSYYEYCLKAYILLSDDRYLSRFNTHYSAIMTYISQGPMLLDVHMHKPHTNSKHFMDALLAFWPGLQVLKGDLKPAIETHEMLYQVMKRHKFIPEAFTTDFQVHWGQHPLRPEFIESTYFLYKATGDHHYLYVGRTVLNMLQSYARVPCGFASVKDVRTAAHEDSMDSFVLAETFKYLYLLFAEQEDVPVNLDDFIFTTEAHLLPLSMSRNAVTNYSYNSYYGDSEADSGASENVSRFCLANMEEIHNVRRKVKGLIDNTCPYQKPTMQSFANDFQATNVGYAKQQTPHTDLDVVTLADNVIAELDPCGLYYKILTMPWYTASASDKATESASIVTSTTNSVAQCIKYTHNGVEVELKGGPAHFGKILRGTEKVAGKVAVADPLRACSSLKNKQYAKGRLIIAERGDCMFVDKAHWIQDAGAIGGIIVDNRAETNADTWPIFAMSGEGDTYVGLPFIFLFSQEAKMLLIAANSNPEIEVTLSEKILDYPMQCPTQFSENQAEETTIVIQKKNVVMPPIGNEDFVRYEARSSSVPGDAKNVDSTGDKRRERKEVSGRKPKEERGKVTSENNMGYRKFNVENFEGYEADDNNSEYPQDSEPFHDDLQQMLQNVDSENPEHIIEVMETLRQVIKSYTTAGRSDSREDMDNTASSEDFVPDDV